MLGAMEACSTIEATTNNPRCNFATGYLLTSPRHHCLTAQITFYSQRPLCSPAAPMSPIPQMKDLLKLKNKYDDSLLVDATLSKNAVMFDAVLTFVGHHLSSQEVI